MVEQQKAHSVLAGGKLCSGHVMIRHIRTVHSALTKTTPYDESHFVFVSRDIREEIHGVDDKTQSIDK